MKSTLLSIIAILLIFIIILTTKCKSNNNIPFESDTVKYTTYDTVYLAHYDTIVKVRNYKDTVIVESDLDTSDLYNKYIALLYKYSRTNEYIDTISNDSSQIIISEKVKNNLLFDRKLDYYQINKNNVTTITKYKEYKSLFAGVEYDDGITTGIMFVNKNKTYQIKYDITNKTIAGGFYLRFKNF